jgi:DNA-binding MarR family transcriptional regulator
MSQQNSALELIRTVYKLNRLLEEYEQGQMSVEGLHDLQPSIGVVLLPLLDGEGQTLSALAGRLNMKAPTVTVIANRLEERGWIKRVRGTSDRRQVHLYLTDSGRAAAETLAKIRRKLIGHMATGFDRGILNAANITLSQIHDNILDKMY